jgi:hypothetical protein
MRPARLWRWLKGVLGLRPQPSPSIIAGEPPLRVFISSVMRPELVQARAETVAAFGSAPYLAPWAFEYTPASSENLTEAYLRHVREADLVVWLVGEDTSDPVRREIREALASDRRLITVRLRCARRDEATESLLREVSGRVKWVEEEAAGGLNRAIELSIRDEIVRAMRGYPGRGRLDRLEEIGRASRARCIARWQAAGISRLDAAKFADDPAVGSVAPELSPSPEHPLRVLVGELGLGKSLIGERLLQRAMMRARGDASAPIPAYMDARACEGLVQETVERAVTGLGDPRTQGAMILIDNAELFHAGCLELITEARAVIETWPRTVVVVTSRPHSALHWVEERVSVQPLSASDSDELIGRVAGRPISLALRARWPESIRDAVRRPLFALLLGSYLRDSAMRSPRSTGELLSDLVDRALQVAKVDLTRISGLLQRLAAMSIDRRGAPVTAADVAGRQELQPVIGGGLVVEESGQLSFPLPILTEWFAAESLSAGNPAGEALAGDLRRLELWRYALIIFVATRADEEVSRLLEPIARRYPGFAALVVTEALVEWQAAEQIAPPPAQESVERVRRAMQAWVDGIGALAQLVAPVRQDGALLETSARADGQTLTVTWYAEQDRSGGGVLPRGVGVKRDWVLMSVVHPGRQAAWIWRSMLQGLAERLSRVLQDQKLPVRDGPLGQEAAWHAAMSITRRSPGVSSIPISDLENALSRFPRNAIIMGNGGRPCNIEALLAEIQRSQSIGDSVVHSPWPQPDRNINGIRWTWEAFSDEQILARATAVFGGALEGYRRSVQKWFPSFAPTLSTVVQLPVRLKGMVAPKGEGTHWSGPLMTWWLEVLPPASQTVVDLRLVQSDRLEDPDGELNRALSLARRFRGDSAAWIVPSIHSQILDIFGAFPMTDLAYGWLRRDLNEVQWK